MNVADDLRAVRTSLGYSQRELGERCSAWLRDHYVGAAPFGATAAAQAIQKIEAGRSLFRATAERMRPALSAVLGVEVPELPVLDHRAVALGEAHAPRLVPCPHCGGRGKVPDGG